MDDRGGSNRPVWQRVQIGAYEPDQEDGADLDANLQNQDFNRTLLLGTSRPNRPFFNEPVGPPVNQPRRRLGEESFRPRLAPGGRNAGTSRRYNSRNFSRYRGPGKRVYQGNSNFQRGSRSRKNRGKQSKKRGKGGYYVGSRARGASKNGPRVRRMKRKIQQSAFYILKTAYINESTFNGLTIEQCYSRLISLEKLAPRPEVKTPSATLPPDTTFAKVYIDMRNEVAEEFKKRQLYSGKKTARATIDASLGQVMAGVVKFEDAKKLPRGGWRNVLRNAVLHYTKAICKLELTGEVPQGKKALNEKAICDLYYSRAQAYCMLQRYGDFWSDALVALSLSPYVKQMELVTKLVEKRIEQVRLNADPRQKNRRTSEAAVKKWREDSRAALKRAEDFLLLQAIIDQQNDNKINRLMVFYTQIAQLRKERLVEGDKPKPPRANPTQPPEKKPKAPATNIFDAVEILEDNRLRVKKNIAKNRIVFYEQVIAFESGSGNKGGLVNSHCANCFRRLSISKAVPCSVCSDALFCNAICREVAQGHTFACQLTAQVRSKLSKNSYFAFQLICYCNFYILFTTEKGKLYRSAFTDPFSITGDNDSSTIDYWPRYAVIAAVQKRIDSQAINVVTEADQRLLADALYLTKVLVNIATVRFVPDQQIAPADEIHVFSMMYKLLWIVHHDPMASTRLGKRKDFALCPFGTMLNFSCKPNVKRKFNPKKGRIEYQALVDLKPNDILSVSWGSLLYAKEKSHQNKVKRAATRKKSAVSPRGGIDQTHAVTEVKPMTRTEMVMKLFALNHPPCPNCPESKTPPAST